MIFRLTIQKLLDKKLYTLLLTLSLSLTFAIFITFSQSTSEYKKGLSTTSNKRILVAGGTQGHLKTILNSLYFKKGFVKSFEQNELETLRSYGSIIPVFNRYTAFNKPLIGIAPEYFSQEKISLAHGDLFLKIGQCVLGSKVAEQLGLSVGDSITSDADAGFDINKSIPIKMEITGILEPQGSSIDRTVFTSLKTAWTMHGIGHEHVESESTSQDIVDFTKGPLKNFHFHGEERLFPLTSALIFTKDSRSKGELQTLALENKFSLQIINPAETLIQMNESITRVSKFFYLLFSLISLAMLLILFVFIIQSSRIRSQEKLTYKKLGLPSSFYRKLIACEWIILTGLSLSIGYIMSILLQPFMVHQISLILSS